MERFLHPIKFVFNPTSKKVVNQSVFIEEKLNPFEKKPTSKVKILSSFSILTLIVITFLFTTYSATKFLPETYLEDVRIGGLTTEEALQKVTKQYATPPEHNLYIEFDATKFLEETKTKTTNFEKVNLAEASSSAELLAEYDYQQTLQEVMEAQQKNLGHWLARLLIQPNNKEQHVLKIKYNQEKIVSFVETVKKKFDQIPGYAQVTLNQTNNPQSLVLDPGKDVLAIDLPKTTEKITQSLAESSSLTNLKKTTEKNGFTFQPEVIWLSKTLESNDRELALKTAEKLVGKKIVFTYDVVKKQLNDQQLISFLKFPDGFVEEKVHEQITDWKKELDRPAQNADFEFDKQTFKVAKFVPHREGLALDEQETKQLIYQTIEEIVDNNLTESTINKNLVFVTTTPETTLEKTNSLGIKERIGFGDSFYAHSIPTRIHNVALAAERINYTLVAPGKEFSFNKVIGDISAATGYQSAYVIKDGQTVLGDGGGVCQVSTTLFRSLLDAGLNITLRLPHSYRVSYYELDNNPGFDATVYAGNVDLRFINDTENYVLVYTETDSNNLYMKVELYGTSDGRTSEISNYKSWGFSNPPPPVYVPDPSLPTGKLKQIDWAASGIKAEFTYTVRDKDGNVIHNKTYYSNYRPWAAKYLQGV